MPSTPPRYLAYLLQLTLVVGVLGLVSLPAYIEIAPENVHGREYAIWSRQLDFARSPADLEPEVLVLGDSRVLAAVVPEELGPRARSLALGGSLPIDGYYLLRTYLAHHRPPRALLVSYAPDHLERRHYRFLWERSVKFGGLDYAAFREIAERAESLGVDLGKDWGRDRALLEWWLYRLRFPTYYAAELKASRLVMRRAENLTTMGAVDASRGHALYGDLELSRGVIEEAGRTRFRPSPLVDAYLRELLALAGEASARVVYASMPVSERSFAALDPAYLEGHAAYLRALAAAFPRITFETRLRAFPDDHFGDRSHVNERGARRATQEVAALLR